jgi:sodium-coupled monocarboxylate transporter 8/12
MQVFPTALSITVSFLSANTILGTPSEIYMYGTMYCYQGMKQYEGFQIKLSD